MNFLKNSKKILSLFIVVILALSNFCMIASANENAVFSDVPADNAYISEMVKSGIIKGYDNGTTFKPDGNMTRAEACTIITRLLTAEEAIKGKYTSKFSDVKTGAW